MRSREQFFFPGPGKNLFEDFQCAMCVNEPVAVFAQGSHTESCGSSPAKHPHNRLSRICPRSARLLPIVKKVWNSNPLSSLSGRTPVRPRAEYIQNGPYWPRLRAAIFWNDPYILPAPTLLFSRTCLLSPPRNRVWRMLRKASRQLYYFGRKPFL